MTVTSELSRVDYVGNDTADTFAYPFKVFADTEFEVIRTTDLGESTTLVLDTDYTVTGAGSEDGGTIVLTDGELPTDYALAILRRLPVTQLVDIKNLGGWFPATHEDVYDRLVMILQQQQEQIDRVLTFPIGSDPDAVSLELPSPTSLYLLRWNAAADALENVSPADIVDSAATGDFVVDTFIAGVDFTAGVTTALPLSEAPGSIDNTDVIFSGAGVAGAAAVARADYSLADDVLTFDAVIPVGVTLIEVKHAHSRLISMPASNSVDTAALQNGAVTTTKLDDEAVTEQKIADGAVTSAKMATGALQAGRNAIIDGCAMLADGIAYVADGAPGVFDYGLSQLCKGALAGTTVVGTLTRTASSVAGRTGRAFRWSAVTTTGSGLAKWRAYIEAADALRFKNQTASVSLRAAHNAGVAIPFAVSVYKATVADNFAAVTAIRTGASNSVATATDTGIAEEAIAMGDCSNGIMVEVVATIGAVTGKNFDITELQLELGATATDFEFIPIATVLQRALYYYERFGGSLGLMALGYIGVAAAYAYFAIPCARKRIAPTCTLDDATKLRVQDAAGTNALGVSAFSGAEASGQMLFINLTIGGGAPAASSPAILTMVAGGYIRLSARF